MHAARPFSFARPRAGLFRRRLAMTERRLAGKAPFADFVLARRHVGAESLTKPPRLSSDGRLVPELMGITT